jgi:hypothetical protein
MGDRGNIRVDDKESKIYLYTHWYGSEIPFILKTALIKGRERWKDAAYLTRIIFCEMLQQEKGSIDKTTGFGISLGICDNENPIYIVDVPKQRVYIETKDSKGWTFEEFIK